MESSGSDMFYSIIAPNTIRPFSNYDVVVSVLDSSEPFEFELSIGGGNFNKTKTVKINPNSLELVHFEIPEIPSNDYKFKAKGLSGIVLEKEISVTFEDLPNIVLIQTDKAAYKPGDEVKFRVVVMDKDTKPFKYDVPIKIIVVDSDNNQIKQYNDVKLTCGVFSGDLQLSTFPPLGTWALRVFVRGKQESKSFEVEKYVLPKFKVELTVPKIVCAKDEKVRVNVSAKYTYGKGVKGQATAKFSSRFNSIDKCVKTININGEGFFEIDIGYGKKDSHFKQDVDVVVTVKEDLTGSERNSEASFEVYPERYKIHFREYPYRFKPNVPFPIKISVKDYKDSPVKGESSLPAIIYFKALNEKDEESEEQRFLTEVKLNNQGLGEVEVTLPDEKVFEYSINCKYLDTDLELGSVYKDMTLKEKDEKPVEKKKKEEPKSKYFDVDVKENIFRLYQDVPVEVSTDYKIKNCLYAIVAKKAILQYGKAEFHDGVAKFSFLTTYDMVTSVSVLVYAFNSEQSKVITRCNNITLPNLLPNFIHIGAPTEAQVKDEIDINIRTNPNSYVGLMAVDQSVLLHKSGNDFKDDDVFTHLRQFNPRSYSYNPFFGFVDLIANASIEDKEEVIERECCWVKKRVIKRKRAIKREKEEECLILVCAEEIIEIAPKQREWFPETWLYDFNFTNDSGELTLRRTVPDTITSWILTGFSISPLYGFGISRSPTEMKVFQTFFISTNLPYSVKRGEVILVPLTIFNYMEEDVKTEVTLDNTKQEFIFIDVSKDGKEVPSYDAKRTQTVTVTSGNGANVSFLICPNKIGHIGIKAKAVTPIAGDAINDVLRVEPEGVTKYGNKAIFFNLKEKPEIQETVVLDIPKEAVPDSVFIEISAVGDLLGPTIQNLGSLVRMPYGCGEQNMVNFVPNILVMKYLRCIDKLTEEIAIKAKKFLEIGYQRELAYKHPNGSYSAFGGKGDGSTWLTAYVARSFRQAAEFVEIDERVIKDAIDFLIAKQEADGSFVEAGELYDWGYWGDSTKGLSLTAFTLLALMENQKKIPELERNIAKGMEYLVKHLDMNTDVHSLAIGAYVLQKGKHNTRNDITKVLIEKAVSRDRIVYWDSNKKKENNGENTCSAEITAYGMLAILESDTQEIVVNCLKGLISKRNSVGGFESTQDTVVGLTALTTFSEKYCTGKASTEINFTDDKSTKGKLVTNHENAFLLQTHELNPDARNVSINVKGQGSSFVQVSYRYNIDTSGKRERFMLKPVVKDTSNAEFLELKVYASFIPTNDEPFSNMVVMEANLPSGYLTDSDNLSELEKQDRIKRVETKNGNSVVVIYFDKLDNTEMSYIIRGIRVYQVAKQKPAPVVIYDYYDTSRKAQAFYNCPQVTLNDILVTA